MDKITFNKNGQWSLNKGYHRSQEEQDKSKETPMFKYATMARPQKAGSKQEIEQHTSTNKVLTDLGENMYHHVFANQLGDTRHILSSHKDPNKEGVAGTLIQTDGFYTGFRDNRPVSAGIKAHVPGKGYGKSLLEAAINHHGEWHSGESFSPAGDALISSVAKTGKYHHTPDVPQTKEFHDNALAQNKKGLLTRVIFKVNKPTTERP